MQELFLLFHKNLIYRAKQNYEKVNLFALDCLNINETAVKG